MQNRASGRHKERAKTLSHKLGMMAALRSFTLTIWTRNFSTIQFQYLTAVNTEIHIMT